MLNSIVSVKSLKESKNTKKFSKLLEIQEFLSFILVKFSFKTVEPPPSPYDYATPLHLNF